MKQKIASILCLVLLVGLVFTGCNAATLEGKWTGEIDFTDTLNQQLAQSDAFPSLQFRQITLPITVEFSPDGEFILSAAPDGGAAMAANIVTQLLPVLQTQLESTMGMSMDDLLTMTGLSLDALAQQAAQELVEALDLSALNITRKYKAADGILYIGNDLSDAEGYRYTITFHQLTIQANDADNFLLPLTLKKAQN